MIKWHRFGHLDKNIVRKGDRVKKGQQIGTVGNGNGQWYAHLHYDISNKDIRQEYISGWSKDKVQSQYLNPHKEVKLKEITEFDHMGYDYLAWNGSGYHPGVDINGKGAGNADFGNPIYSPVDGIVTYEVRTWFKNGGWGNILVIREDGDECKHCPIHCPK